ncbi:hypothetical protein [Rhodovulum marinum]|uniref:hypothetical protein n=1 Tax=Rhodovulum marinum TaxID=320662 RepID=UPI001049DB36|nr:hypothetical protein [Rhodovulum marinum]
MKPQQIRLQRLYKRMEDILSDPNLSDSKRREAIRVRDGVAQMLTRFDTPVGKAEPQVEEQVESRFSPELSSHDLYTEAEKLANARGAPAYLEEAAAVPIALALTTLNEMVLAIAFPAANGAGLLCALAASAFYYLHARVQNKRRMRMIFEAQSDLKAAGWAGA